jgi:hypothetical protein
MRRYNKLSELSHIPTPKANTYSPELIEQARDAPGCLDWPLGEVRDPIRL